MEHIHDIYLLNPWVRKLDKCCCTNTRTIDHCSIDLQKSKGINRLEVCRAWCRSKGVEMIPIIGKIDFGLYRVRF